ncbi:hypothetical protein ZIOFF_004245 [Zingiber officinale]|uniref:Ethylene insensitive 3-like DNA-binding domain-containing protein n=1 Tax=Zingiber officinale TaxID=94328 RepID=A0A8J5I020_ZINOF|nr:hypothetical protein ZIOFF_004245 [Zingiber officinale]
MVTLRDRMDPFPQLNQHDHAARDDLNDEESYDEIGDEEEIGMAELERRMWKDQLLLKKLKQQLRRQHQQQQGTVISSSSAAAASATASLVPAETEQSWCRAMSCAQDRVLRSMLKMMDECNASGFVYDIVPESNDPVMGSSDSLCF